MIDKESLRTDARLRVDGGGTPHSRPAGEAALEWEARYKDLFEAANDVILMLDADGNVLDINRRAEQLTGYSRTELVQSNVIRDLAVPEDEPVIQQVLRDLMAGQTCVFPVRWHAKDRSTLFFEGSSSPRFSADGKFLSTRCILRNVTDRTRAEEQVRAKEAELAHMARLSDMGEMATGLAHEVSEPLSAISNYAQGAVRRLRRGIDDLDALVGVFEDISAEAARASTVIHHLRRFVRKREPWPSTVDVNDIVQDALRMLGAEIRIRGVSLMLHLADDLPSMFVDAVQIQQCVVNLIRNSLDAMDEQPTGPRELTLTTQISDGEAIDVAVSDTGRGFADGIGDKAFEPFITTRDEGLGMGLAISRSIIEAHGGQIGAVSNPGHGVTIHFTLPPSSACERLNHGH